MERNILILIALVLALSVVSCSPPQDSNASTISATQLPPSTGGSGSVEMSTAMQLAFGTLMLDKTSHPLDSAQAANLLILWKAAISLSQSDTTAVEESNGLLSQIQSAFTSEQLQAIQDLGLSNQNLPQIARELGLDFGGAGFISGSTGSPPDGGETMPGAGMGNDPGMGGGSPPAGGMPPGGGAPPEMGVNSSGSFSSQTSETDTGGSGSFLGVPTRILEAVIAALKAKIQS